MEPLRFITFLLTAICVSVLREAPTTTGQTTAPTSCVAIPDCTTCVSGPPLNCYQCRPGYGTPTTTDRTKCVKCSTKSGCAQCATLSQCTRCNSTALGPKMDGSGECAACAPNCRLCSTNGAGKCDSCVTGYNLQSDKTCSTCALNCVSCVTNGGGKCDACQKAYYLNSNKTCTACGTGCIACSYNGAYNCTECQEMWYLYSDFNSDTRCAEIQIQEPPPF